jgi:hypothetical protein
VYPPERLFSTAIYIKSEDGLPLLLGVKAAFVEDLAALVDS